MRKAVFEANAIEEVETYKFSQPKLVFKIFELIIDIDKHPFTGLGKAERLQGSL